jgi:phage gpG-like protein
LSRKTSTAVWEELLRNARGGLGGRRVKVGVLASKGGMAKHTDTLTIIELAAIHEFGSPAAGIPERSFIRATLHKHRSELAALSQKLAGPMIRGKTSPDAVLKILGEWAVAKIRAEITTGDGIPPPLKPRTIARKGSSRPLVDTGRLLGAITYEITPPSGEATERGE